MFKFPAPCPLELAETFENRHLREVAGLCQAQPDDPFDELARLINGGPAETSVPAREAAPSVAVSPAAPVTPPNAPVAPAIDMSTAPASGEPEHAAEPVLDLSALRAAFAPAEASFAPVEVSAAPAAPNPVPAAAPVPAPDLADEMRSVAQRQPAPPADRPVVGAAPIDPFAQFEAQLSGMLAADTQRPIATEAPSRTAAAPTPAGPVAEPVAAPVPPAPPAPSVFDAAAFAAPSVPETEMPVVVGDAIPGLDDLEQILGNELEAALEQDLAAPSAPSPASDNSRPALDAMGIPAALMAAAAEREIGAVSAEPVAAPEPVIAPERVREPQGRHRTLAASVAALAIFGASASVAWMVVGSDADGEAPIVLASTQAVKVKPADAGGATIPNQDTALFTEGANKPHQVALKRGSEAPVEVAKVRPVRINTSVEKPESMKARRVRTVVVKPDGTIISAEAGADPQIVGSVPARVRKIKQVETAAAAERPQASPKTETEAVETRDVAKAKLPEPADQPVTATPTTQVAAVEPKLQAPVAPAPAPAVEAPRKPAHDGYVVQISSRRSEDAARKAFGKLQRRFSGLLGTREAEYLRKDIEGKGTFYRVRVLAESKSDASGLCRKLKKAGGACFVSR